MLAAITWLGTSIIILLLALGAVFLASALWIGASALSKWVDLILERRHRRKQPEWMSRFPK